MFCIFVSNATTFTLDTYYNFHKKINDRKFYLLIVTIYTLIKKDSILADGISFLFRRPRNQEQYIFKYVLWYDIIGCDKFRKGNFIDSS